MASLPVALKRHEMPSWSAAGAVSQVASFLLHDLSLRLLGLLHSGQLGSKEEASKRMKPNVQVLTYRDSTCIMCADTVLAKAH